MATGFNGSLFNYFRNDALDAASKYDDKKQDLEFNQFGGSVGGPDRHEPDVLLRQLRRPEADDRPVVHRGRAERRSDSPHPGRRAGRQRARARARRGRRRSRHCSPASRRARSRRPTRCSRSRRSTPQAEQTEHALSARVDHRFTNNQSLYARVLYSDGDVDTPDRTVTPRRVHATQQPLERRRQPPVALRHERDQRAEGRIQPAEIRRPGLRPVGIRPVAGLAVGHGQLLFDRRARDHGRGAQRSAGSGDEQLLDQRSGLQSAVDLAGGHADGLARHAHVQNQAANTGRWDPQFQFLGSTELTYHRDQRVHRQPPVADCRRPRFACVHAAAVLRHRLRAGHVACLGGAPDARTRAALRLLLCRSKDRRWPSRSSSRRRTTSGPTRTTSTTRTRTTSRRACRRPTSSTARRSSGPATGHTKTPASSRTAFNPSKTTWNGRRDE